MHKQWVNLETGLSDTDLCHIPEEAFSNLDIDGLHVLCIIPDSTRSMPMPMLFRGLHAALSGRVKKLDFLIALGTHPPMSEEAINTLLGITALERHDKYKNVGIFNHEWQNPDALQFIGTISEAELSAISNGLMQERTAVYVNRRIFSYDLLVIAGPVFPHEVVGFSGGNKYFFPGISGAEILNLFHWLGALITNPVINGVKHTPVRTVIDKAASFIGVDTLCFCLNVVGKRCNGVFFGSPETAWSMAADLSAQTHIRYMDHPFKRVLAMAPRMYDDIWTAGKCMYKLEPVVEDNGELIIYAPHVKEISITHGDLIRQIGYHTRDYFLANMDHFTEIPGGILAHSTHVRGIGTCIDGVESPRVRVTLATSISESVCHAVNLGYLDPEKVNPVEWENREEEGLLLVSHAGETLYRLKSNNPIPADPHVSKVSS